MSNKHLSFNPQKCRHDQHTWYYEENKHILIVHHSKDGQFHNIKIPWYMLRRSLGRKDRDVDN